MVRILIDMDGVLSDSLPTWLAEYRSLTNDPLRVENVTSYNFTQYAKYPKILFAALELGRVFERSLPMPGALEAVSYLSRHHDIQIVTYNVATCRSGFTQKLDWLQHYLPRLSPDNVTFTCRKEFEEGDILVEDSPENLMRWLARHPNGWGVLISHKYNEGFKHGRVIRATTIMEGVTNALETMKR